MPMRFLVDQRKPKAAASSLHQFCATVRAIFRGHPVDDSTVEAITVYLYVSVAGQLFGRSFVEQMDRLLHQRLKYAPPAATREIIQRVARRAEAYEHASELGLDDELSRSDFERHVVAVIRALLGEAGLDAGDDQLVRATFMPFEHAIRTIKNHLLGIKRQNHFLMHRGA